MDDFLPYFPELHVALRTIVSLNDEQYKVPQEAISGPEGFAVTAERCRVLATRLQTGSPQVATLISSLEFLYQRSREWVSQRRDVLTALRDFFSLADLEKHLGDQQSLGYTRLGALLVKNPIVERQRKIKWLQTGILETATAFASFVELRPNYTDDRAEIEEFVPVTIFRIVTESDLTEDHEHIFQLTPEGLQKLREAIDDVENKLKNLYADKSVAERVRIKFGESRKE
jgi:hypothetical protein